MEMRTHVRYKRIEDVRLRFAACSSRPASKPFPRPRDSQASIAWLPSATFSFS